VKCQWTVRQHDRNLNEIILLKIMTLMFVDLMNLNALLSRSIVDSMYAWKEDVPGGGVGGEVEDTFQ
jgi:hypothetical protein